MLARSLDVLLIASAPRGVETFRALNEQRKLYVLIDREFDGLKTNYVGTNDNEVGAIATEHLIESGCRQIAHIAGQGVSPAVDRLAGYRDALARQGLPVSDRYISSRARGDESGDVSGYDAMKPLLKLRPRPDGVFCYKDLMAIGRCRRFSMRDSAFPKILRLSVVATFNMRRFCACPSLA